MKKAILAVIAALLCGCSEAADDNISAEGPTPPSETQTSAATTAAEVPGSAAVPATSADKDITSQAPEETSADGVLRSKDELALTNTDGTGSRYEFSYGSETFTAVYTPDNWKIIDSYKITNEADMLLICEALSDEHPIHGRDMVSYRVPEDMVYEWQQHNLAYSVLPDTSNWKQNAKDVDLNPEDQGKSLYEMFISRVEK